MASTTEKSLRAHSRWTGSSEVQFKISKLSNRWSSRRHLWRPPPDLYETGQAYVVRLEIAGMEKGELNISLEGRSLAVYGVRKLETERASYHQMEVRFGEFLSLVELPGHVQEESIRAEYNDGFLIVALAKAAS